MKYAGALSALLMLGACVAAPLEGVPPTPTAQLPPVPEAPVRPTEPAPPPIPPAPPPAPEVAVAVPPPPVAPPPRVFNPADLKGKQRDEVVDLLGGPAIARRETGAELLLYEGEGCVLYVFLYEPPAGGALRVEYTEVGPRNRDPSRDRACLAGMLPPRAGG